MVNAHLNPNLSRRSAISLLSKAGAVTLGASALASSLWACSGVGPPGKPVVFGDQTNIVIWDEATQTEHFIRNANFRSGANDFGFIAPTPGKPELHEASNKAFYTLAALAPVVNRFKAMAGAGGFGGGRSRADEVQVVQEADVAGYHATTLWSKSAQAVNDWMNEHGYVSTPEVEKWAERYCGRGWFLTAFKVTDKTKLAASTGTIRMSFHTQNPYNPFYVPSSNILVNKKGTLRVYFVSVGDYDANIGPNGETWKTPSWTSPIPEADSALLAKQVKIPAEAIPDNVQVETFVDNDFPRPAADDIYFEKRRSAAAVPTAPSRLNPFYLLTPIFGVAILGVGKRRKRS
ncbi:MAG TPA: DUF2330 domain-containing protein [Fimbriimonadaceae bacterium]|jgi:hypothetical protein